ncbi:hypothetical protein ABH973_006981 [Bradyrhizobium ottawaense]
MMVEEGQTNRIRMANRAISEYQRHVGQRDDVIRSGSRLAGGQ